MAKPKKRQLPGSKPSRNAAPPKRSPRSEVLPGLEPVRSKPLDNICEAIGDCRTQMNTAATEEERLRSNALQHMQKRNITVHRHAGVELVRVPGGGEKLRVRLTKEEGDASVDTGVETSSDVEPDEEPAAAVEAGDELRPGVHAEH